MKAILASALLVSSSVLAAPYALASTTYIGSSLGKQCFEAVSFGDTSHGDLKTCTKALESGTLAGKDLPATYVNRGILLMRMERFTKAIEDYERALELNPELAEAKINMGAALIGLRRYASAIDFLEDSLASQPMSSHVAYYNLGIAHERLGDYQGARGFYRSAIDVAPDWRPALNKLESLPLKTRPADPRTNTEASR